MSQNITWLGASYSDVPAVTLPKTGGGTARFTDVTDTTAIASDVAAGKYFHLAAGERVQGTASGGGGDTYTLTTVVPQQTFTPQEISGSYQNTVTYTAGLEDGEAYLVTFDGEQYVCECGVYWGTEYLAGYADLFWGIRAESPYPFGIGYSPSVPEFSVGAYDTNPHTIKVEHLEFVDGPLTIIPKSVTANGTYNASSDNADGYSSVTVNVPTGGSTDFVVTLSYNSSTGMWEPDCTINELQAAYAGGKDIAFVGEGGEAARWFYDDDYSFVYSIFTSGGGNVSVIKEYWFTAQGISHVDDYQLVSPTGDLAITQNGNNIDVAEYATVSVNVSGGSSKNVQVAQSTTRVANTAYTKAASLTCSKAGTYDVYWDCFRSSTSGTSGSQLYIGGSAYGSANTTFSSNIHSQSNHLTGVQISADQEVAVYVRSRATNYYAYCGQLTIVQTA